MDKEKIKRFLNGLSSKEEELEIAKWLEENNSNKEINTIFEDSWEESGNTIHADTSKKHLWEKIDQKTGNKTNVKKGQRKFSFLKSAAVWLLLAGFLVLSAKVVWENNKEEGEQVVLSEWVEKSVPSGEKLLLTLPDKSKVLVNSNSKIKFPTSFEKNSREVYLEGEAFFEVKKDSDRPFFVFSGELTTEVLGTSFNINSRLERTKIALLEGKVKVKNGTEEAFLSPGEMVDDGFNGSGKLEVTSFIYAKEMGWKDGHIKFRKKPLKAILQQLEDWYGVKFEHEKNINLDRTVTGTFQNDNLDNLLSGLGFTMNFNHTIDNKYVKLNSN
ncbi:MAG: DUF4974 domain-containing protein [Cytophagales bacterium]|uniref:FecR family protein n=1 Tax=Cyclobacterium marinum TaxID=104 RepID=UPI0030D7957A|nr:DUF4974 domain-containing protein [Cytophagales bacterium]